MENQPENQDLNTNQEPVQAEAPQDKDAPRSNPLSNKFLWLGIVVILLAVLSVGGYFVLNNNKKVAEVVPTATPTPVDETANWKTYMNSKYGFEFKYPDNWTLSEENSSTANYIYLKNGDEKLTFEVVNSSKDNLLSSKPTTKSVEFNSILWNYHESFKYCDAGECGKTSPAYTAKKGNLLITFTLSTMTKVTNVPEQILSTFKFTNSESNSATANGVTIIIDPNRGPTGTKVNIVLTGITDTNNLGVFFVDSQMGFPSQGLFIKPSQVVNGSFSGTYIIPSTELAKPQNGAQNAGPEVTTAKGIGHIEVYHGNNTETYVSIPFTVE